MRERGRILDQRGAVVSVDGCENKLYCQLTKMIEVLKHIRYCSTKIVAIKGQISQLIKFSY
jgi:hypothetical protein